MQEDPSLGDYAAGATVGAVVGASGYARVSPVSVAMTLDKGPIGVALDLALSGRAAEFLAGVFGDVTMQAYEKGIDKVDPGRALMTGVTTAVTSKLAGSVANRYSPDRYPSLPSTHPDVVGGRALGLGTYAGDRRIRSDREDVLSAILGVARATGMAAGGYLFGDESSGSSNGGSTGDGGGICGPNDSY